MKRMERMTTRTHTRKKNAAMRKQAQPQRGTKMHKEAEELLIAGRKRITGGTADFLGLNSSALSASSAVHSSCTFPSFFVASRAFLWPFHLLHPV
jgi:hypothetical protein